MPETDLFLIFVSRLGVLNLRYMVTGSVAGVFYGEPRVTHDVDIVLDLPRDMIARFHATFPLDDFYCPPKEVLVEETQRTQRGHFNLIHHQSGFRADVYLCNRDPFHLWALGETRTATVDDVEILLAPPEYVITRKLEFYREGGSEKHLLDIRAILRTSGELIRHDVLMRWVTRLGLEDEWSLASND